jgi:hypothetical protein
MKALLISTIIFIAPARSVLQPVKDVFPVSILVLFMAYHFIILLTFKKNQYRQGKETVYENS